MTTLFNLFSALINNFSIIKSLIFLVTISYFLCLMLSNLMTSMLPSNQISQVTLSLFPGLKWESLLCASIFIILAFFNYTSLICYSYPVTTTLAFNLSFALSFWLGTVMLLYFVKNKSSSSLLPKGSPWYLAPFLSIVEATSISVRPITLCFRLLANMSAGHVMLGLICKLPNVLWTVGVPFGLLELMVAGVQSFVFTMLIMVYFTESKSH